VICRLSARRLNKPLDSLCFITLYWTYVLSFRLCMATTNVRFCTKKHILPTPKPGKEGARRRRLYDANKPDDGPLSLTRGPARRPIVF